MQCNINCNNWYLRQRSTSSAMYGSSIYKNSAEVVNYEK